MKPDKERTSWWHRRRNPSKKGKEKEEKEEKEGRNEEVLGQSLNPNAAAFEPFICLICAEFSQYAAYGECNHASK